MKKEGSVVVEGRIMTSSHSFDDDLFSFEDSVVVFKSLYGSLAFSSSHPSCFQCVFPDTTRVLKDALIASKGY
jgi:hypothetical protein